MSDIFGYPQCGGGGEGSGGPVSWGSVTGKPSAFPPVSHAASHAPGGSDPIEGLGLGGSGEGTVGCPTIKAYATINGNGAILDGYGIASVVRTEAGKYTITLATPMSSANYTILADGGTDAFVMTASIGATITPTSFIILLRAISDGGYRDARFFVAVLSDDGAEIGAEGGASGLPLLTPFWSSTGLPEVGCLDISQNNGLLSRAAFPEAWAKIDAADQANTGAVVDDATWLAEVAAKGWCNKYSRGDGSTTFRVMLWCRRGSIGFPDPLAGAAHGDILEDQMRPITGGAGNWGSSGSYGTNSGALKAMASNWGGVSGNGSTGRLELDSSLLGPNYSGDITHGPMAILTPMLKMYGSIDDPGLINAAATVQMIAAKLDTARFEVSQQVLHVRDEKPTNVAGGTFTAAAWRIRDLNTVVANTIPGASLTNNAVTIPAGTYDIFVRVPAYAVNRHMCRLWDITLSSTIVSGSSAYTSSSGTANTDATIQTRQTFLNSTTFEVHHVSQTTEAANGFGVEANAVGFPEIYSEVFVRRIL